jgi:broad specificity phosphatase PhoE
VIVCHGGVIMVLLTAILGLPQEQRFRFQIDHCSISIVEYDSECQSFRILSVNDTLHLEENLKE